MNLTEAGLAPPSQFSTPGLRDYRITGGLMSGVRALVATRSLVRNASGLARRGKRTETAALIVDAPSQALMGVEVRCERDGLQWCLAPFDLAQRFMLAGGSFEHPLITWATRQLQKDDVVIDIGAHVGLFTTQFANRLRALGGGHVYSFEPAPDSGERLERHLALNDLSGFVTLTKTGLGAAESIGFLHAPDEIGLDDPSQRSLHGHGDVGTEVPIRRFDDWWASAGRPKFDVVKIDVEGAEDGVVEGMAEALRTCTPRLMIVEIKQHLSANAGKSHHEVVERLAALGYSMVGPFSVAAGLTPLHWLDDNIVFEPTS